MATKKKPTTRKTAPKKTVAHKKQKSSSARRGIRRHLRIQPDTGEFMTVKFTTQTLYWLVLGAIVILFTLWLMQLQANIQSIYDQIDANNETTLNMKP